MSSTIIMVIMICLGCATGLAGLGLVAYRGFALLKAGKKVGIDSMADIGVIIRQIQSLDPRLREMAARQKEVAESLEDLSATTEKMSYLWSELDAATGHISSLKS
ncbi:MAG: hypothetical protein ACOX8V_06835 [Thermoleophilia bacterium]|jgi:hypothetical protein